MSPIALYWIIAGIVLIVSLTIHRLATGVVLDAEDFFSPSEFFAFFLVEGWINALVVALLSVIVFGFVFWNWIIMLIILGVIIVAAVVLFIILANKFGSTDDSDESTDLKNTVYKCPNCGASIKKRYNEDMDKTEYFCDYCKTCFSKKDILNGKVRVDNEQKRDKYEDIELSDFEDEYFDACEKMFFRPYNAHTNSEIQFRYDKLKRKIDNFENIYKDVSFYGQEKILQEAYDFLVANKERIEEYFAKHTEEEIKTRTEFFMELKKGLDEDDEDDEDDE